MTSFQDTTLAIVAGLALFSIVSAGLARLALRPPDEYVFTGDGDLCSGEWLPTGGTLSAPLAERGRLALYSRRPPSVARGPGGECAGLLLERGDVLTGR